MNNQKNTQKLQGNDPAMEGTGKNNRDRRTPSGLYPGSEIQ